MGIIKLGLSGVPTISSLTLRANLSEIIDATQIVTDAPEPRITHTEPAIPASSTVLIGPLCV